MHKFITASVGLTCCLSSAFVSAQTISGVSGTVTTGSLLTISGTNLTSEAKANWDPFFTSNPSAWSFEGANPTSDGYGDLGPNDGAYDSTVAILGSKSMKFHIAGGSSSCPTGNLNSYNAIDPAGGDANDLWIRAYVRYGLGGGWPSSHIKMLDSQGSGNQYYFQPAPTSNGALPTQFIATYDGTSNRTNIPSGQLQNNRWYAVEIHWKSDTSNVFSAWIDGVQVVNAVPSARGSLDYILLGLINVCGTTSGFSLDNWLDGFVVAKSRVYPSAMVEVGNSPNYSTATKNVQAIEKISDSQITFKLNNANLGSGPYYVWVRNNVQGLSPAFSLGSGTIGQPPGAPENLRIVQ